MQRIGIKDDVFHPAAENAAGNLVVALEVSLEHQLAAACDQNGVHVGSAREPIGHPAQRVAVDELVLIHRSGEPAVVSRDRNTAAVRAAPNTREAEWRQRSSSEK